MQTRIFDLARARGISQAEIARQAGLSNSQISRIRAGIHKPNAKLISAACRLFPDVPVGQLLGETETVETGA